MEAWSIAVKTVGHSDVPSTDFIITVQPDDDLTSMHDQIEEFTGLKASQQRLIYRGRIIRGGENDSVKNEPKVKDVVGLKDGQTIHLVPRPAAVDAEPEGRLPIESGISTTGISNPVRARTTSADSDSSSPGTAALLAALLGLGVMDDDDANDDNMSLGQQLARLRSARIRNRNRRPNHRLLPSDLEVQDPGTMEPVRQGLMTLHTLLEGNSLNQSASRQWYRGQWIDCRDTVNQWLEATIVEIVKPEEILPVQLLKDPHNYSTARAEYPTTDPAVSANDFEGRMRLLLEPADGSPLDGEWGGYRQRDNNEGVNVMLIHYNGWPHRWDEWIRSDSERIRLFRTRTRHPNSSSTACPTPNSQFNSAPPTNIKSEDESKDRAALLPELQRVFSLVNDQIEQVVETENPRGSSGHGNNVPWISGGVSDDMPQLISDHVADIDRPFTNEETAASQCDGEAKHPEHAYNTNDTANDPDPALKKGLLALIPLLDRLGRTLIDAAPHLAAYAASLPDELPREPERTAPGESNVVFAKDEEEEPVVPVPEIRSMSSLFSLLPLGGRSSVENVRSLPEAQAIDDDEEILEPDYMDFLNSTVNTTRGEVRNRGGRSGSDEGGLLGAYLAAASLSSLTNDEEGAEGSAGGLAGLGRLIRQRETNGGIGGGGGGGGIDIHIHAIVTGPAVGGTGGMGMGMALLGEPQIATARPTLFSSNSRRAGITEPRIPPSVPIDEEELGIFSDLYSENPTPVDLQNGVLPAEGSRAASVSSGPLDEIESIASVSRMGSTRSETSRSPRRRGNTQREPSSTPRRGGTLSRLFRRLSRRAGAERSFRGHS